MTSISVVIPTIEGRENDFVRAIDSFPDDIEILSYRDYPTCGAAWVQGIQEATGEFICLFADDLEAHPGFLGAMIEAVDQGQHPAALVLLPDGTKQSCGGAGMDVCRGDCQDWQPVEWSPTPFIHKDWWRHLEPHAPMLAALQYASDVLVSAVLRSHGIQSVMRRTAVVTHYNSQIGRLGTATTDGHMFFRYTEAHAL